MRRRKGVGEMHCHSTYHRRRYRGHILRSRQDKVFWGVCGGLAEHFEMSSTWIRAGFIIATLFVPQFTIPAYIVARFLMPDTARVDLPPIPNQDEWESKHSHSTMSESQKMTTLKMQFEDIDHRIRRMEDLVTSKEFLLRKKFEEL